MEGILGASVDVREVIRKWVGIRIQLIIPI